jgi:hypothetical protein
MYTIQNISQAQKNSVTPIFLSRFIQQELIPLNRPTQTIEE